MLSNALRYFLQNPKAVAAEVVADPFQIVTTILDKYADERERRGPSVPIRVR